MSGLCSISSFSWLFPPFWRLEYSMRFPHSSPPSLASGSICDSCSRFAAISHISYHLHTPIRYPSLYPACLDRDTLLLSLSKSSIERPPLTLAVLVPPCLSHFNPPTPMVRSRTLCITFRTFKRSSCPYRPYGPYYLLLPRSTRSHMHIQYVPISTCTYHHT